MSRIADKVALVHASSPASNNLEFLYSVLLVSLTGGCIQALCHAGHSLQLQSHDAVNAAPQLQPTYASRAVGYVCEDQQDAASAGASWDVQAEQVSTHDPMLCVILSVI